MQQNACLHENFSANVQKIKIDKKIGVENLQPLSHQNICMKTVQVRHKLSLKSLFKRRTYLYVCKVCIFFQKIVSNGIKNLTVLYNNGFNGFFEGKEEHVINGGSYACTTGYIRVCFSILSVFLASKLQFYLFKYKIVAPFITLLYTGLSVLYFWNLCQCELFILSALFYP